MIIRTVSYPRAGLVGNPSDGYFGKTIAFTFANFAAEITLYQTPELEILPSERDHSRFRSISRLVDDVNLYGYYGGVRLLKAAIKRFFDYCSQNRIVLDDRNFTIRYHSTIPHRVGLAGSSAIITACMRALCAFYQVTIPKPALASLVLAVEKEELRIPAGLQDRVAQVYEGLVYMDFAKDLMQAQGYGNYEELDPSLLPRLYVAYLDDLSEGTEVFHNNIRDRFDRGDTEVVEAMHFWADLAQQVRALLIDGSPQRIGPLLDSNFDRRRAIYRISEGNIRMVETARSVGASAKFSGSGGAIVGTYADEVMYEKLEQALEPLGVRVVKPKIVKRGDVV
ncbi:MAG: GHMP kinase [Chitinivibrionales bacterium]|nr:GHMP kinase [Chitinivibrionales bacterium]